MADREKGIQPILQLTAAVTDASRTRRPPANQDALEAAECDGVSKELWGVVQAFCAVCSNMPVTSEQLKCLLAFKDRAFVLAADLATAFVADPWWSAKLVEIWNTAVAEASSADDLAEMARAFKMGAMPPYSPRSGSGASCTPPGPPWAALQTKLPRWNSTLRSGATRQLLDAVEGHLVQSINVLLSSTPRGYRGRRRTGATPLGSMPTAGRASWRTCWHLSRPCCRPLATNSNSRACCLPWRPRQSLRASQPRTWTSSWPSSRVAAEWSSRTCEPLLRSARWRPDLFANCGSRAGPVAPPWPQRWRRRFWHVAHGPMGED